MIRADIGFVAAGGNRNPAAADWDAKTGTLAYGSDCNIALWKPQHQSHQRLHALLRAHDVAVNAVRFLDVGTAEPLVVSGSATGAITVLHPSGSSKPLSKPEAHSKAINALATVECRDTASRSTDDLPLFVSASADGTLGVWQFVDSQVKETSRLTLKPNFIPLTVALARVGDGYILAVSGTRNFIQIYTTDNTLDFQLAATLTGHEGWIRSLSFAHEKGENSDLLLASASQDKYIRLWRMREGTELPPQSQAMSDPLLGSIAKSLSNKAHMLCVAGAKHSITFEALLLGHEDWIFTAKWHKQQDKIRLLSASADSSISIWEADPNSGIWAATVRLGELCQTKGATTATGSAGGFWIGLWAPDGRAVVSLGRTGSWRLWKHQEPGDLWTQDVAISGHIRAAQDVAWSRDGQYLLSTGLDQTTRVWAEWIQKSGKTWHEISRAQIHGYDLNCVSSITPTQIISGADEKLLRVFDQPRAVAALLTGVTGKKAVASADLPDVASIPVLGLSNKALGTDAEAEAETNGDAEGVVPQPDPSEVMAANPTAPPTEDQLSRHLLWPETEKLYGHGYEISCVAASHDGKVVATACKASSLDHAVIRLYDTTQWREVKPVLTAHSLTVTRLSFSPDDKYLLSVGRDRQLTVFERVADESTEYKILASDPKAHSRMILDCAWAPRAAEGVFFTAGRDKAVHVWRINGPKIDRVASIPTGLPVTAVDVRGTLAHDQLVVAHGLEDGSIHISTVNPESFEVSDPIRLDEAEQAGLPRAPSKSVTRLQWRPASVVREEDVATVFELAVASEDTSVRVLTIELA